jgi:endo-1,4-beta-xylanase
MKNNPFFKKEFKILSQGIMKGALTLSVASLLLFTSCSKDEVIAQDTTTAILSDASTTRGPGTDFDNNFFFSLYAESYGDPKNPSTADISFPNAGPENPSKGIYPGNFTISYKNTKDCVGGKGWSEGISARNINYNIGALSGSRDFVGVYGWCRTPLTEYYVAEMGGVAVKDAITHTVMVNNKPVQQIVSFDANGHKYYMYKHQQVSKPSIDGIQTFWQYQNQWAGSGTGSNHSITMSTHFYYWNQQLNDAKKPSNNKFGTTFGARAYQIFGVEAYSGKTGSISARVW